MPWQDWKKKAEKIIQNRDAELQKITNQTKLKYLTREGNRHNIIRGIVEILRAFMRSDEGMAGKYLLETINSPLGAKCISLCVKIDDQLQFLTTTSPKNIAMYAGEFYDVDPSDGNLKVVSPEGIATAIINFYQSKKLIHPNLLEATIVCNSMLDFIRSSLDQLASEEHE